VFVVAGILVISLVNHHMRQQALAEAEEKALMILEQRLAIHAYFSHDLKPRLFEFTEPIRTADYFEPTWMSSTYAIREIHNHFTTMGNTDYYYKECAINARSPQNEADDYERTFIDQLNTDPELKKRSVVRNLEGEPYFVTLYRGEVMEESCLRCHSTPEQAPGAMVNHYGPERSFGRNVGDVVSAVSIRVPLSTAYANANRFSLRLSGLLLLMLLMLYAVLFWLNKRLIFVPLSRVRDKAHQISTVDEHLGEQIPVPFGRELSELTIAFNAMSQKLRIHLDQLEERVKNRTADLEKTNNQLTNEITERNRIEQERERLITELQEALKKVKTLRGLLPICASCKKIRDDKGYWNQLEAFIRDRSDAEFSHAICPDCACKLYPDFFDKENE
jgi:HAMP domain-containing protein